jgi:hypothetical protein
MDLRDKTIVLTSRQHLPADLAKPLVYRAALCGHLGAVIDLLKTLPGQDFNYRAQTAFHALWTLATGIGHESW